MASYRVYCNDCDEEFSIEMYGKQPQYCCGCGSEIIYGDLVKESSDDEEDDSDEKFWDKLSSDELDALDDWKVDR